MKLLKLLDCTLRDGGYYNNWDFSKELIEEYLQAMSDAKIEYVELGFRFLKRDIFLGPCAYTTVSFLESLKIPSNIKIGIMINAKDILSSNLSRNEIHKNFFQFSKKKKITLVRFACHLNEVSGIIPYCRMLKKRGFEVGLNLMQISEVLEKDIEKISKIVSRTNIDVFYFADSLGSLEEEKLVNIIKIIKKNWKGELGFHAHDNKSRALVNCVAAFENGVNWIDSTVTGMGRGPGNVQTEFILLEFAKYLNKKRDLTTLMKLIENKFSLMKNKFNWGTNPYYYLAGKYSIHPTFIQSMLNDLKLSSLEIFKSIENLKKRGGSTYDKSFIEAGDNLYNKKASGTFSPSKLIKGRNVLIIGSGPSSRKHSKAIENFIKKKNLYVIALNNEKTINEKLINLRACCHTLRIMSDVKHFRKLRQPLVLPLNSLPEYQRIKFKKIKVYNFGLQIKTNKFSFGEKETIAPNSLTISYALSLANSGKSKKIYVSGLDGYSSGDLRLDEMEHTIDIYQNLKKKAELISITPSKYKIKSTAIYAI